MARTIKVGTVADFPTGEMVSVDADGTSVIVVHDGEDFCAAKNRCPHLGLSLTKGPGGASFTDGVVQCPWHNSRFELCSGETVDWTPGFAGRQIPRWSQRVVAMGRKPAPLTTLTVVVDGEDVLVELP